MATPPIKISRFWQELKRRNVIKVIAMYGGGAFVLIELVNNVVEPLNLPDWTPRLVIIATLVGFPLVVILSWMFDITPEGLSKTDSMEGTEVQESEPGSSKRRIRVSDVIIAALIIVVGILLYPRVFGRPGLNTMTFPVTVVNEFGERETRRVVKEKYITKLVLFPFENISNDSTHDWMRFGIIDAIHEDHLQFPNILIDWYGSTLLNEQISQAENINIPYFLTGTYQIEDDEFIITSRLHQSSNGAIKVERVFRGENFFRLMDSLCVQVRIDLAIPQVILNSTPDLSLSELITEHFGAYAKYIEGRYPGHFGGRLYTPIIGAIELDSTFALALYRLAERAYNYMDSHVSAETYISQAMQYRGRLSELRKLNTRLLDQLIRGDTGKVVDLTEYQMELNPFHFFLLEDVLYTYSRLNLLNEAKQLALQLNKLIPENPVYKLWLADSYLFLGTPGKANEILVEFLNDNPSHVDALLMMGEVKLHQKDLDAAEEIYKKAILLMPEQEIHWSKFLKHIEFVREKGSLEAVQKSAVGNYRHDLSKFTSSMSIINKQIYYKPENQVGMFMYPISDTTLITAFGNMDFFNFFELVGIRNMNNELIVAIGNQWNNGPDQPPYSHTHWRESSSILAAKEYLKSGKESEALTTFRKAFEQHPEHYYLANYIKHLEFIQSPEFETIQTRLKRVEGSFGDMSLQLKGNRVYWTDSRGLLFQLLPIAENHFMVPTMYSLQIEMIEEDEKVAGMKFLYHDGSEEFVERTVQAMAKGE